MPIVSLLIAGCAYKTLKPVSPLKSISRNVTQAYFAAEDGDARSQHIVGNAFLYGSGNVKKNKDEAFKWLTLATDQGYAPAFKTIGDYYKDGDEVDFAKAVKYYEIASDRGSIPATLELALMYHEGDVVDKDFEKSISYWKLLNESRWPGAEFKIAEIYEENSFREEAIEWYELAEKRNHGDRAREARKRITKLESVIEQINSLLPTITAPKKP